MDFGVFAPVSHSCLSSISLDMSVEITDSLEAEGKLGGSFGKEANRLAQLVVPPDESAS